MMGALGRVWGVLCEAYQRFLRHDCAVMAAATSFYSLLSLFPLALLAISLLGHVLGTEGAQQKVIGLMEAGVPGSSPAVAEVIRVIARREGRWFVNIVGLFGLLWSGSSLLSNLSAFLTVAWTGSRRGRGFVGQRLVAVAAIVTAGALFALSIMFTGLMSAIGGQQERLGELWDNLEPLRIAGEWLISTVVATGMFFLLYRFLPAARVAGRAALVGAIPAAVLWHISRRLFSVLVASSSRYGEVYGPLAGVVILMLWVYYSGIILFLCAEVAASYQERFHPEASGGNQEKRSGEP